MEDNTVHQGGCLCGTVRFEAHGTPKRVGACHCRYCQPELIERMKDRALRLCNTSNAYYRDQFGSPDVTVGYEPMGQEIANTLGCDIDLFCASVGTGGALMGTWQGLAKSGSKVSVVAFEPSQSPFLTTGKGGAHKVEGVGVGFEPPFLDRTVLSEIRTVDQEKGFSMCRRLA